MTKTYFRKCRKCGELMPYLTYFLSKIENRQLSKADAELCYDCYRQEHPLSPVSSLSPIVIASVK